MNSLKAKLGKNKIAKILVAAVMLGIPLIFINVNYAIMVCCIMAIYIIAVSGFDILAGYCGQMSLGHAAFFAIGAYGSAMMHQYFKIPIIFTMILASILAAAIGALIAYPAVKLVSHFLALATIAFGIIVYQILCQSPGGITGNFTGFFTQPINLFGLELNTYTRFYYFGLVCVVVFLILKTNLVKSRMGRAFIAIRENSHAADGMGINVRRYKVIAFATSAFYTGFAGAMYAHLLLYISPDSFMTTESIMFMTMLLFGGSSSLLGPIFGVATILLLNEALRSAQQYQMLIYGILLLIVIVLFPGGVYGMIKSLQHKIMEKYKGVRKDAKC